MPSYRLLAMSLILAALFAGCQQDRDLDPIQAARSALEKGKPRAMLVAAKSALQVNPNLAEGRFLLGTALFELGDSEAALVEYQKAGELGYDTDRLAPGMARTMLSLGQFKLLIDKFASVELSDSAAQGDLLATLALAYSHLDQSEKSRQAIDKALSIAPTSPYVLRTKANFIAANGQFDDALMLIERSLVSGKSNGDAWLLRAEILQGAKRDFTGAADAYSKALEDPRLGLAARYRLVDLYLVHGPLQKARQQIEELKKRAPDSLRTAYLDAVLSYQEGDYKRARDVAARLAAKWPNDPRLQFLSGSAELRLGALLPAEAALGKAVNLAPGWQLARWHLAQTYMDSGQLEKAKLALAPIVNTGAPDAKTLAMMATIHLHEGDLARSDALFARAAALRPTETSVRTSLALADLARGRSQKAFDALRAISEQDPGSTADMALINAHLTRRDFDQALDAIARLRSKKANATVADQLRGVVLQRKGDLEGARKSFEAALDHDPGYFPSIAALARLDMLEMKHADARHRMEAAIKASPKNNAARMALVDILVNEGAKPDSIKKVLEDAIRSNPSDSAPRLTLIALHRELRDVEGALSAVQDALGALPDDPAILDVAGQVLVQSGHDQQAVITFNKLANANSGSPIPHLRLAQLHSKRGNNPEASSSLRRAIELAPDSIEVHRHVVAFVARTKDFRLGTQIAAELKKRLPKSAAGDLLEGDVATLAKKYEEAEASYRRALGKADPSGRAAISVFLSMAAAGQESAARGFIDVWMKEHPSDATTRLRLAEYLLTRKDGVRAEKLLAEVLTIDPMNIQALAQLAAAEAVRGSKDSLAHAHRAAVLSPLDPGIQSTLARSLELNGRGEEAIRVARRALALSGGAPELRLELAKMYARAGQTEQARMELDALVAMGAGFARSAEAAALRKSL